MDSRQVYPRRGTFQLPHLFPDFLPHPQRKKRLLISIAGVIAILGVSALAALSGSAEGTGLLYASSILVTISSAIQIIAGAKGLKACKIPETAGKCVTWGIVIAVLSIISMVIGLIGGGDFNITNLALNLLVPGLYVYGALKTKSM